MASSPHTMQYVSGSLLPTQAHSTLAPLHHTSRTHTHTHAQGNKRATDTRPDEQAKGITIKSTGISLQYELPSEVPLPASAKGISLSLLSHSRPSLPPSALQRFIYSS